MKVYSRTLRRADLYGCVAAVNDEFPGVNVYLSDDLEDYTGPRSRSRRFEKVKLRGTRGIFRPNTGNAGAGSGYAASYAEWGWWLARVFELDPDARCGQYANADDFHEQTNQRFRDPRTPRERQVRALLTQEERAGRPFAHVAMSAHGERLLAIHRGLFPENYTDVRDAQWDASTIEWVAEEIARALHGYPGFRENQGGNA